MTMKLPITCLTILYSKSNWGFTSEHVILSRALPRRECALQVHVVHWHSMSYNWATFHFVFQALVHGRLL